MIVNGSSAAPREENTRSLVTVPVTEDNTVARTGAVKLSQAVFTLVGPDVVNRTG
jgi:hypothetical protein